VFRFEWFAGSVRSVITIISILLTDSERIQPQRSRSSQRTHKDILWGHLTHYPILKAHDNLLTAAGPLVGYLGDGGLPTGPGLAPGCRWGSGGPAARSRPGGGGRMSNISAGQVSMLALRLRLLLAAICKATTNEPNHRAHRVHRGRTETSCRDSGDT